MALSTQSQAFDLVTSLIRCVYSRAMVYLRLEPKLQTLMKFEASKWTSIFTVFCFVAGSSAYAQSKDSTALRTKVEAFQSRSSSLIQKEFVDVSKTKLIVVQVVRLTDLKSNATVSGVVIEWGTTSMGYFSAVGRGYLDSDELEDLSNSVGLMIATGSKPLPVNYTELNFSTKSGLEISLFKSANGWAAALDHNYKYKAFQSVTIAELTKLQEGLQVAKSKL